MLLETLFLVKIRMNVLNIKNLKASTNNINKFISEYIRNVKKVKLYLAKIMSQLSYLIVSQNLNKIFEAMK
ncbi:MAG: hypothetical protein LBT66_06035 [Methanobrevibacter sp.]|jgi:hypothetical protein|nr:hypothetical protein [Candidatus Methanovirga meridionalis]